MEQKCHGTETADAGVTKAQAQRISAGRFWSVMAGAGIAGLEEAPTFPLPPGVFWGPESIGAKLMETFPAGRVLRSALSEPVQLRRASPEVCRAGGIFR